jgi:8-oxo-dGTP pyrophosphatase MutT (NUDIX family)
MPGGKRDATDGDASCTALRETEEEVGIRAEHIDVLAVLRPTRTKAPSLLHPPSSAPLMDAAAPVG